MLANELQLHVVEEESKIDISMTQANGRSGWNSYEASENDISGYQISKIAPTIPAS